MFGPVGMSYVYFTYGMYFMLNVVAKSKKQNAGAVLIRGVYPQDGIKIMIKNRGMKDINKITNGPGKLTMAMNISMKENNLDLTKKSSIYISEGIIPKKIKKSPRIGITKATDKKWNFSIMSKDYF
jgi:DNA-3-methyladenine glycosylase